MPRSSAEERRRDKYTYYRNDAPITDLHEALDVLWKDSTWSNLKRYIYIGPYRGDAGEPELHVEWYTEGDSGGDMSGWHYLQIDPELVKKLVAEELVTPNKVLYMGGSYLEKEHLVLSERGKEKRKQLQEEKKAAAVLLMRPGIYQNLAPPYDEDRIFSSREHGQYGGKLCFKFEMLSGDRVKVFPDSGEIEATPPKEKATGA